MKIHLKNNPMTPYLVYLSLMVLACSGAFIWQFCFPQLADSYSVWNSSAGWQREIALWNVGLIASIVYAILKQNLCCLKLMTFQSAVLCWVLGLHHLYAFITHFPSWNMIHALGVGEVLLLGGVGGSVVFIKYRKRC